MDAGPPPRRTACASLQEATRLIQEEFAFDGYLDNGLEALIMGTGARGPRTCAPAQRGQRRAATGGAEPGHPRADPGRLARPGEYIHALKDLTYATFCGAVSEKFCDLHWGERLLQSLFGVVNGRTLLSKT